MNQFPCRGFVRIGLTIWLALGGAAMSPAEAQNVPERPSSPAEIPRSSTFPGVVGAPFPYASPEEVGLSSEAVESLAARVVDWVDKGQIVGAEILIVKDRRIILHEVIGWSDREAGKPLRPNSIFQMRSMTKPFTGTAALMLVEEGKLDLDARVARYLPSWNNRRSGEITVRQLLTHTSGFEQGGTPAPRSSYPNLRAVVDAAGDQGPQHAAGQAFRYSDINSYALGALVTELAGLPIEQFIEERILRPLGLDDTHTEFVPDALWADRVNPTYRREDGKWVKNWSPDEEQVESFFRASGGLYSTVFDYARWLAAWLDWGDGVEQGLLSPPTVRSALTPTPYGEYGFHWGIVSVDPLVFHHDGAAGTDAMAIPSHRALVLYFTHSGLDTEDAFREAAVAAVAPELRLRAPLPSVSAEEAGLEVVRLSAAERALYSGLYAVEADTFRVWEAEERLKLPSEMSPGWPGIDLIPLGDHRFAFGRYAGSQLVQVYLPRLRLRFVLDGRRVTGLEVARDATVVFRMERVPPG